jgi:hypothetical protein
MVNGGKPRTGIGQAKKYPRNPRVILFVILCKIICWSYLNDFQEFFQILSFDIEAFKHILSNVA